jgi:hypothetical protein
LRVWHQARTQERGVRWPLYSERALWRAGGMAEGWGSRKPCGAVLKRWWK